ncbi:Zinc finger MYM-type protein 1 [Araneus ventricosus]|uniref:Zinc finger MYM-type protein 1 n=1 Tax=Araneus ventricosus TaxID=182803 RepID=A0A4Y2U8N0_ARAVE|nr:Zinc finger MYM-type protein 1 [Araneus ventricosus]
MKWLEEFEWLAYSEEKSGSFCKYCVIFSHSKNVGKGDHQLAGALVTRAFSNLKKAKEMFRKHENCTYHKKSVLVAENTKFIVAKKKLRVLLIKSMLKEDWILKKNRKRLIPIIQTIRFCGRQQIAVRGHREGGRIGLEEPEKNDGNFRSFLRYRADSGDNHLKDQLMNSGGRNMYTSSFIQNELINTFGHLIQYQIVRNVRKSIFSSILADETTVISQIEQFSLCVRYVEDQSDKIREDFLTFVPVYDVTGAGLANTVLETLLILGLDLKKMRGQGYGGAATMREKFRGVQASIKEKLPLALYTHCSSYSLNLFLSDATGCCQLHITYPRNLKKNIDLSQAIVNVNSVLDLLSKQRVNANDNFKILYAQLKEIAAKLDIKEDITRVCRPQTARNNVPYNTEEEYYRRAVYVPYLDDFCNSLKERFESHKETVASLKHILPEFCTKTDFYSLEAAFNFYEDLSHKEVVQSEFMLWKEKWSQEKYEKLPKTAISSLEKCDKTFCPNIYILVKL